MKMHLLFAVMFLTTLLGCGEPQISHPNIDRSHIGTVVVVDWGPRTFTLQEDKSNALVTLHPCGGVMPVWQFERIQVNYHVAWNDFTHEYYTACQRLDWVERKGPDSVAIACARPK
jgi:hypothetical protein